VRAFAGQRRGEGESEGHLQGDTAGLGCRALERGMQVGLYTVDVCFLLRVHDRHFVGSGPRDVLVVMLEYASFR
jgi:hypothetical protein